jgi:hypothetical protein
MRVPRPLIVAGALVGCVAVLASPALAQEPDALAVAGVSLKVRNETAPPGSMAQMKVYVTEPKPISTGKGRGSFSALASLDGIALMSPANDAYGVAIVTGTTFSITVASPSATFGLAPDYPVLTVAGRVPADSPMGASYPMRLDAASLEFRDPAGTPYPVESRRGTLSTAPGVSIHDVRPGSADLPAGSVVTLVGSGFEPGTEIRFEETALAAVNFVDSTRIDVVLGAPARMHGMGIRAINPDGSRVTYFSYQRTRRAQPSGDPVLAAAVPVFPFRSGTVAVVDTAGSAVGLAVQNLGTLAVPVTAELRTADGVLLGSASLRIGANRFVVRESRELFGRAAPAGATIRVRARRPVQVMGVAVEADGTARPILPR